MKLPDTIFIDFFRRNAIPQLLVLAESGYILQANDAASAYYGTVCSLEFPLKLSDLDVYHPSVTLAELNLAAKGIEQTIRSIHRTALGTRDVNIHTSAVRNGNDTFILATIHDVTEQITRERVVTADEERWRSALAGSGDGIWDWDVVSDEVFCSPRWKGMLGYGPNEVGNDIREWLSLVCDEDRNHVETAYEKMLAGGCSRLEMEYRMHRKNGGISWILDRCSVLRLDIDGRPARIISVHSDITSRKQIEAKLRLFNESLEKEVQERTVALNNELIVREETEQSLRAYQERLALLAEELCLTEERERRRLAAWLHDDIGQNLALLKIQFDRMNKRFQMDAMLYREISDLLTSTIKEIRNRTIQISPPLLQSLGLVPAIIKLANDLGAAHGFLVQINEREILPDLPLSLRSTLFCIVRELLINIVKHANADSVIITVIIDGAFLGISIKDNGLGFDQEQLEASLTNNSFGLFHIKHRLKLLGGVFYIDSIPGCGSCCALRLPLQCSDGSVQESPD